MSFLQSTTVEKSCRGIHFCHNLVPHYSLLVYNVVALSCAGIAFTRHLHC
jgi:hypothetical protein